MRRMRNHCVNIVIIIINMMRMIHHFQWRQELSGVGLTARLLGDEVILIIIIIIIILLLFYYYYYFITTTTIVISLLLLLL